MDIKNLGKTIAELRKKKNMSQQELADKLNVSNKTISKWECGNGTPDIVSLNGMANIFGVSLDELINSTAHSVSESNSAESAPPVTSDSTKTPEERKQKSLLILVLSLVVVVLASVSLLCFFFIPRSPEIVTSDVFNIDSTATSISCTVDNATEKFSFSNSIVVPRTNTWNVYYDLDGSKAINSQTVSLQPGDNTFYVIVENSAGDKKTYEVTIRRKPLYVVSFNTNGGENIINEIVMEGDLATYQEPVKEGYIFGSWDFDFATPITSNITVNASWIAKNLTIIYYANNGAENSTTQHVTYNEKVVLKSKNEFAKIGYTLTSWNTKADGSGTSFAVGHNFNNYQIPNDIELYAQWGINQYTVSATQNLQNAGSVSGIGAFDYGTTQTITATTNAGYTWEGWYSKDNVLQTTAQNLTVTIGDQAQEYIAKWVANPYEITLNTNGGNQLLETTKGVVFGQNFVLPVATRTEAVFLGWFNSEGTQYTNNQGVSVLNWDIANDTTLYAHYKINEYQVSLSESNDVGGEIQGDGLKEYGSEVSISAHPKAGYSFVGWYSGSNLVSASSTYSFEMPNYPISYVARWKANIYTITMNVDGGTALSENTQDVTFDTSFSLPITSKTGYTFVGWYLGINGSGQQITDSFGNAVDVWNIADDTVVYAKWNVINYKINYILNGGSNHTTNPSTYNVEDDDITLNYPTKEGYTFNGWVVSGASVAEKTMIISSGSIGEKTYAASWSRSSSFIAISSAEELQAIQNNPSGNYYLTKDIDLSGFDWTPISEFNGVLDGSGHSIVGLTFTSNDIVKMINWKQLAFILSNKGKVLNLSIENATMASLGGGGSAYFAVLVVFNDGTINGCSVNVNINSHGGSFGTIAYNNNPGGIISNCSSSGIIDGDEITAGGIVGYNEGIIKNCHSNMTLKAVANTAQQDILAGICATNGSSIAGTHSTIENCFFTGTIENGYYQYGIAYNYGTQGSIKNCFVDAVIGNSRDSHFGGSYTIANAVDSLSVQNCYYSSSMTMPSNTEKIGTATSNAMFKDKEWLQTTFEYHEFINEVQIWLDDSNIWVFAEGEYPKLYWEC